LSPSGLAHAGKPNGRAATLEDMEAIKAAFVKGALAALQIGACGIEVHACHGYLLDQFLWAETNRRANGYGGDDMAARVRFPAEIVRAIRSAVGPAVIISFRFSQWKEVNYQARIAPTPQDLRVMLDAIRGGRRHLPWLGPLLLDPGVEGIGLGNRGLDQVDDRRTSDCPRQLRLRYGCDG
jgi:2,4-dienoyl-CoA reductase-like NADH-dependent reductase (Old Yellow Enzyme family)